MMKKNLTYKEAGVDIDAGDEFVERLKKRFPDIGGFGGLYPLNDQYLVASTDGVGTKLKLAFQMGKHDTIGIDLVAMNVNDILTTGAKPLFFLDYYATSKLHVDDAEKVLSGIAEGCAQAGCLLLGGETAEMPGFYHPGEYDLAGFCVGIVNKDDHIDGRSIQAGDSIVGIPSSGIHSNGYSLVRKVLDENNVSLNQKCDFSEQSIGELLLTPTTIYVKEIFKLLEEVEIRGMAHITGGGLLDNIPRILPKGLGIALDKDSWTIPPLFTWLQHLGNIPDSEMVRTFNLGIGMALIMPSHEAAALCKANIRYTIIGEVVQGEGAAWL